MPDEVEGEVLPLAPVGLGVGQEGGSLSRSAGLLKVMSQGVVGPVVKRLVVQGQSTVELSILEHHHDHCPHHPSGLTS